jgi:septum site-determining protein MinC
MMKSTNNTAFQLKGSLFTLTVLNLITADLNLLSQQLGELVKQTPRLFQKMPIVVDLQKLEPSPEPLDFSQLIFCLRENNLIPVGVRGGNSQQHEKALQAGLAIMPNTKVESFELTSKTTQAKPAVSLVTPGASKIVDHPVRSGQQIYARNSDLIVISPVSAGAELIADGNIHVYGTLRGRALAGVNGNNDARILCHSLEAELVSIAGHYWISEDLQNSHIKQNVHIYLENDKLHVNTFDPTMEKTQYSTLAD